jgi:UDP-3-O-[3-hydroxymyristoyl] glucosamine N-acyltransferase
VLEPVKLLALRARSRGRVSTARDVRVSAGARVRVRRGARVILGPGVALGADSRIEAVAGTVRIGAGARVGERAVIVAHAGVEIGPRAVIGDWAALTDVGPTWGDVERPVRKQPLRRAAIRVGAGAVLGPHASLGPGAAVPPGTEIAPYQVVPPWRGDREAARGEPPSNGAARPR